LHWLDTSELERLQQRKLLTSITVEGQLVGPLGSKSQQEFERRLEVMRPFLDFKTLQECLLLHQGLGGLVRGVMSSTGASRSFVYHQWSNLCRWGFNAAALVPRRDRCGAPGVPRRCDPPADGKASRNKAGRKTTEQRIARTYGIDLDPKQPGMSTEWAARIRAADKPIPTPKPSWPKRCALIVKSAFCGRAIEVNGKIELAEPVPWTYPNNAQIKRVLTVGATRLQRLLDRTTRRHFERARRGLTAKSWQGVAGPGHTWMIDSTIGDIYLRSSIDRAWIVGRPIVYVIVDVWSTAVVGFYVCLSGPSWTTAKVSLFDACADPFLVGGLWGYEPIPALSPGPGLCYELLCDRGEYLSQGHRQTALKLKLSTAYTPPYRGDLKGLAEVLHRIEKDAQFLFIPGAMNFRRAELELRKVNPEECVLTVREYVHYLHQVFVEYNLTADRSNRMDAHMTAARVFPSPAGLWRWGHDVGIAFQKHIAEADLVSELLPKATARVGRNGVMFGGADYMSDEVKKGQWTADARNFGGWDIDVHYYPGSMGQIWTPNSLNSGLTRLRLMDESSVSAESTFEEWSDTRAQAVMQRPDEQHQRMIVAVQARRTMEQLLKDAKRETAEAVARSSGKAPSITEARIAELAATTEPSQSEAKVVNELREDMMDLHEEMLAQLLRSATAQREDHDA
jgi:hypothetical protein